VGGFFNEQGGQPAITCNLDSKETAEAAGELNRTAVRAKYMLLMIWQRKNRKKKGRMIDGRKNSDKLNSIIFC
jgi:hypothetical protein